MPLTELLPYLSLPSRLALLAVLAVGAVAALALVGARFLRRGPARFWLAPSFVTLACLPLVAGASLAALGLAFVLQAVGIVGVGSGAAVQAGIVEAELPLLLGSLCTAAVAVVGLTLLAVGRARPPAALSASSLIPSAIALGVCAVALALALAFHAVSHRIADGAASATSVRALAWLGAGCVLLTPVVGLTLALRAPRGSILGAWRALSLGSLGALFACTLAASLARVLWLQRTPLGGGPAATNARMESPAPAPRESMPLEREVAAEATPIPSAPRPAAAATPRQPLRLESALQQPKKVRHVPSVYPADALQARVQGVVILECVIGEDGRIARVKVLRGVPLLDQAATEAVRQWEYEPTVIDGVPVPVIVTVTVNFRLS